MTSNAQADRRKQLLNMPRHLAALTKLAGRQVRADELGTPQQAAAWREAGRQRKPAPESEHALAFGDLRTDRFNAFVAALVRANPAPVHVWIEDTIHCGALVLPSLAHVHFDFDPDLTESGVIVFSTEDREDRLLLDWTVEAEGDVPLLLELAGAHWSGVRF